ncbi:Gfo/Idh/MocA family oxidoreductase [Pseudoalteromonas arctica]|uniref:Gfo/Idh/MocA family oxidoreductase n=1 Tax=Pseudoalteromonas arctica TaxID=394751 RepID=A0AAP6Y3C7_9GAMM|nr:Gfo/Idh/MocA family oxidoreductase [Pseudoalteromonas arctica]NMP03407.1 Gfo/Idh/MocA family oxidoreductase [Pseudoalteromonas arctica]
MANKYPLKIAFIGGGNNSAVGYVHFSAAHLDNKFQVVAGAFSRNKEVNQQTAKNWNIPKERVYTCWQAMIDVEKSKIDAVVVLTPTPHHTEVILQLLSKNIPIICEKSLTCGVDDTKKIDAIYDSNHHFLAVTFNYSGYAMVRELKHIIAHGRIGDIQKIHLEMPQEGFKRPPDIAGKPSSPQKWRLKDYDVPTICLDLGVHLHHLSSYLLEIEPESTCAQFANHSEFDNLIDDVNMLLKYPGGVVGSMWMSKTAIGHRNGLSVRVYGTKGSAKWFQLNPDELELNYNDGRREILDRAGQCQYANQLRYNRMKPGHPTGFIEAFANLYADIAKALHAHIHANKESSEYVFGFEQAQHGLALFEAAKRSAEEGNWQKVKL